MTRSGVRFSLAPHESRRNPSRSARVSFCTVPHVTDPAVGPVDHVAENRRYWDAGAANWVAAGERAWAAHRAHLGDLGDPQRRTRPAARRPGGRASDRTRLRYRATCRRGCAVVVHRSTRSTTPPNSSPPPPGSPPSTASTTSSGCTATPSRSPNRTARSTSPSASTAPRSGATRTCGSPRRIACCGPAVGSSSSATTRSAMVCTPADGAAPTGLTLEVDYFGLGRLDWTTAVDDPGGIEFNMEISSWMRLFDDVGFDVVDFHEIRAPSVSRRHRVLGAGVVGPSLSCRTGVGARQALTRDQPTRTASTTMFSR